MLIDPLLQYKPFADFYGNEIKPLGYTIRYFYNPTLPFDVKAQTAVNVHDHTALVGLGNISPSDDLAFIVAHELATIVIQDKGYPPALVPLQPQNPSCVNLVFALNDMIATPARDAILASYGFNVERAFYAYRTTLLFSLPCAEGNSTLDSLAMACYYVQLVFYWQVVLHHVGSEPPIIDRWFFDCSPVAWTNAKNIWAMIGELAPLSPKKVPTLLQEIISKYSLENCIAMP
jgi:hypothetical protein